MMRSQSSSVRNTNTPCLNVPCSSRTFAIGGMTGLLPVAMTSVSYALRQSAGRRHLFLAQIDLLDARAGVKRDAVGRVPRHGVDEDVVGLVAARQHAREQNAVVVAARLVAEHRDVEAARAAALEQIFDESRARHAVADDDQPLFTHRLSIRTAHTLNSGMRLTGSSASFVRRFADDSPGQ